jgi:hypothetical protein
MHATARIRVSFFIGEVGKEPKVRENESLTLVKSLNYDASDYCDLL